MKRDDLIIVRGGGDLATGTIHRLWAAGLRVLVVEIENPAAGGVVRGGLYENNGG